MRFEINTFYERKRNNLFVGKDQQKAKLFEKKNCAHEPQKTCLLDICDVSG